MGDVVEVRWPQYPADLLPQRPTRTDGHQHGVDAQQADPAQDERHHRGVQRRTTGQATGGDGTAVVQRAEHIGQGGAADTVDGTRPPRFRKRPGFGVGV